MSYKVFGVFLAAFPLEGTDPGRPENQVMSSFLFIVVASDEESVYRKNIFGETSYQSLHYMKPCLKIPNISRSTGNVYARIIILNLVAL